MLFLRESSNDRQARAVQTFVERSFALSRLAGIAEPGFHARLSERTTQLIEGLTHAARATNVPFSTNHVTGMLGLFFTDKTPVRSLREVMACNVERFKRFFHGMLQEGVYLAPSAFEAGFVSSAHTEQDVEPTLAAARSVFAKLGGDSL